MHWTTTHAYHWVVSHGKLLLLILCIIIFSILLFWWGHKNRKIRALENQLAILVAKSKIERLEIKYNKNIHELTKLKEQDAVLTTELDTLEHSLKIRLAADMTADEIAEKFRDLGL